MVYRFERRIFKLFILFDGDLQNRLDILQRCAILRNLLG